MGCMLNDQLTDFNFVPRRRGAPADADFDPGANDRSSLILDEVKRPHVSLTQPADEATTMIESGFDAGVLDHLRALGYRFSEQPPVIGAVQAAVIDPNSRALFGYGDSRRNRTAVGLPRRRCEGEPCVRQ